MRRTLFGKSTELERLAPPSRVGARRLAVRRARPRGERRPDSRRATHRKLDLRTVAFARRPSHSRDHPSFCRNAPPASQASSSSVFVPLALALLIDVIAGAFLLFWRRMQMAPHTVGRVMCGYIGATGTLWTMSSVAAGALQIADGFRHFGDGERILRSIRWRPSPLRRWRSSARSSLFASDLLLAQS